MFFKYPKGSPSLGASKQRQRKVHGPAMNSLCELHKSLPLSGLQFVQWQNGVDVRIQGRTEGVRWLSIP